MKQKYKFIGTNINMELYEKAQAIAKENRIPMRVIFEDGLKSFIKKNEKSKAKK